MPKHRSPLFFLLPLLLVGCVGMLPQKAVPPPPRSPVQTTEKVVYVVPNDPAMGSSGEMNEYYIFRVIAMPISESQPIYKGDTMEIPMLKRFAFAAGGKSLRAICERQKTVFNRYRDVTQLTYYIAVSVQDNAGGFVMTLTPKEREIRYVEGRMKPPTYSEDELLDDLSKGYVQINYQVYSIYDKESVYARFGNKVGPSVRINKRPDLIWGTMPGLTSVSTSNIAVDIKDYNGGSKTTVNLRVYLHPTSIEPGVRTIDVKKFVDDAKKEIGNIVNG